ncbi:MAG TPA: HPr kinase/phosphatase C-terminal domain-containing protein [Pseudolabrys sp.]|nr:HPr kinase/phosphatase C-terminal domain-containing protein [Pseudolabrys sp.]
MDNPATIHASAVLIGRDAVLIRGSAGTGKSRLAWRLIDAAGKPPLAFVRLVADDRVHLEVLGERLLARPSASLAGLIEIRGLGIRRVPYEAVAAVGLVIDLAAADAERLPRPKAAETVVDGVRLPRLAVAAGIEPLPMVLAFLATAQACD